MIAAFDVRCRADGQASAADIFFDEYTDLPVLKAFPGLRPAPE